MKSFSVLVHKRIIVFIVLFAALLSLLLSVPASADSPVFPIMGQVCELSEDSRYEFSKAEVVFSPTDIENVMGTFSISGIAKDNGDMNGVPCFTVKSGNLVLQYSVDNSKLNLDSGVWHVIDDIFARSVDDIKLNKKLGMGTLILQTSLDGETWVTDIVENDIFKTDSSLETPFYQTKDVQLDNGCYYRVIVAYKMEIQTGEKKVSFVKIPETEEKKIVEIYSFFATSNDPTRKIANANTSPRKELGQKVQTKRDNGFEGTLTLDKNDPHFGWDLGTFIVNGYTRDTEEKGVPVFLKNVGDKVVLWFKLEQNINRLNGDSSLSIAEDKDGYDTFFQVKGTNFKHGTLIIRFTDKAGKRHEPVVYSDFLAANAKTGADTRVQLFEEGDYEVALDYEIKNSPRQIAGVSVVPTYTNYKIYFEFKIRNGNCMVYPFDIATGDELSDHAWTADGFQLDMARSRYLTIDVQKSNLSVGANGQLTEDVRFNRPAQDGESYTEEGIYVFTVKNLYTGASPTTKTIYVGDNQYLRALSENGLSIKELNAKLAGGATVQADGAIS